MSEFSGFMRQNRIQVFGIIAALFLYAVYAAWSMRIFYPDGTIFFMHILEAVKPVHWHWDRQFAYYVQHFPLISSIKAGVTDIDMLARIHTFWYFSFGWLSLAGTWFVLPSGKKGYFLFPLLWMFAVYMNTEFFPITPGRLLTAIYWVIFYAALFRKGWGSILLVICIGWPLLRIYQGMLILGPLLSLVSVWKVLELKEESKSKAIAWALMALWFAAGAVLSFISVLNPQDPTSFITFLAGILLLLDEEFYPHWPQFLSLFSLLFLAWSVWKKDFFLRRRDLFMKCFYVFAVWVAVSPLLWPESLAPETHQQVRSLNIYFTAVISVFVFLVHNGSIQLSFLWKKTAFRMVLVLGLVQVAWALQATAQWNSYLDILKQELAAQPAGLIPAQETTLLSLNDTYGYSNGLHNDWDTAYMSILFAPDRSDVQTIIAHSYGNVYFPVDPSDHEQMPDLQAYGVNLEAYWKARAVQDSVRIPDRPLPDLFKWFETETVGENDFFEED